MLKQKKHRTKYNKKNSCVHKKRSSRVHKKGKSNKHHTLKRKYIKARTQKKGGSQKRITPLFIDQAEYKQKIARANLNYHNVIDTVNEKLSYIKEFMNSQQYMSKELKKIPMDKIYKIIDNLVLLIKEYITYAQKNKKYIEDYNKKTRHISNLVGELERYKKKIDEIKK